MTQLLSAAFDHTVGEGSAIKLKGSLAGPQRAVISCVTALATCESQRGGKKLRHLTDSPLPSCRETHREIG